MEILGRHSVHIYMYVIVKFLAVQIARIWDVGLDKLFQEEKHSGFLNEAKEWAGELLSGQTKVGRGKIFFVGDKFVKSYQVVKKNIMVEENKTNLKS